MEKTTMSAPLLIQVGDETFQFDDPLGQVIVRFTSMRLPTPKGLTDVVQVCLSNVDIEQSCYLPVEVIQELSLRFDHFRAHGTINPDEYRKKDEPAPRLKSRSFGDTEVSQDMPALVALARTQERIRKIAPDRALDVEKATQRLSSEASKRLALAILNPEQEVDFTVSAKAAAIRKLALGDASEDILPHAVLSAAVEEAIASGKAEREKQKEKEELRNLRRQEGLKIQREKDTKRIEDIAAKWFPLQVESAVIKGNNQIFLIWEEGSVGCSEENPFLPYDPSLVLSVLHNLYGIYFSGTLEVRTTRDPDWPNMDYTVLTLAFNKRCF